VSSRARQHGAMRDALRIAGALAPHVAGKVWDDGFVRRAARDGVPARVGKLCAADVSRLLREAGWDVAIRQIEVLDHTAGTTSRARVALRGASGPDADAVPGTLFAKLAPTDLATRLFVNLMGLGANEVRFYAALREAVAPHLDVPAFYGGRVAGPGGRFVLLLEDLAADPGVELRESRPLAPAEARPAVEAIAGIQAALWRSPRFDGDLAWLKRPGAPREVEKSLYGLSVQRCLRRFGGLVPEDMQRAVHLAHTERDRLEALWARDAHAFSHGDPHLGNFYLRGGRPGFYDWQVCQIAQGTRDLAYFLVMAVDRDRLPAACRDLVGAYRDALVRGGVDARPLDTLLEQVRLHVLYVLIAVVVAAASSTLQSEAIVRSAVENVTAAFSHLDPLGAWERAR